MTDDPTPKRDSVTDRDSTTDDMRTTTVEESAPKATMGEFSHANPYTGGTFGDEMAFERGPAVAADGGRGDAEPADGARTMKDVDHEHPHEDAADANRVFARGHADDEGDSHEAASAAPGEFESEDPSESERADGV